MKTQWYWLGYGDAFDAYLSKRKEPRKRFKFSDKKGTGYAVYGNQVIDVDELDDQDYADFCRGFLVGMQFQKERYKEYYRIIKENTSRCGGMADT